MRAGRRTKWRGGITTEEPDREIRTGGGVEEAAGGEVEDLAPCCPLVGDPAEQHPQRDRDEWFFSARHAVTPTDR